MSSPFTQLFMAIIWTIIEVLFIFFYFSLPTVEDPDDGPGVMPNEEQTPKVTKKSGSNVNLPRYVKDASISQSTESAPLLSQHHSAINTRPARVGSPRHNTGHGFCSRWCDGIRWRVSELWREELVVLLAALFSTMFNETTVEVRAIQNCIVCDRKLL